MTPCPATIAENRTKRLVSYVSWISIHLRGYGWFASSCQEERNDNDCLESQNAKILTQQGGVATSRIFKITHVLGWTTEVHRLRQFD